MQRARRSKMYETPTIIGMRDVHATWWNVKKRERERSEATQFHFGTRWLALQQNKISFRRLRSHFASVSTARNPEYIHDPLERTAVITWRYLRFGALRIQISAPTSRWRYASSNPRGTQTRFSLTTAHLLGAAANETNNRRISARELVRERFGTRHTIDTHTHTHTTHACTPATRGRARARKSRWL